MISFEFVFLIIALAASVCLRILHCTWHGFRGFKYCGRLFWVCIVLRGGGV